MSVDVRTTFEGINVTSRDVKTTFSDINVTSKDVKRTFVDINVTSKDVKRTFVDINVTSKDVKTTFGGNNVDLPGRQTDVPGRQRQRICQLGRFPKSFNHRGTARASPATQWVSRTRLLGVRPRLGTRSVCARRRARTEQPRALRHTH